MNNTLLINDHHEIHEDENNFKYPELYSFLASSLCVLASTLIPPLFYSQIGGNNIKKYIPWFSSFGVGVILSLIFHHNFVEINEMVNWDDSFAIVFLSGVFMNYITLFSFNTNDHCCEEDKQIRDCCHDNPEIQQIVPNNREIKNIKNRYNQKHWAHSIIIGDSFCNFSDGLIITSSFLGCSIESGFIVLLGVILHEISHEIGDFSLILNSGYSFKKSIVLNFISSLSIYLGWIVTILLDSHDIENVNLYLLTFSSGMLSSLTISILPKIIKNKSLFIQNLRLFTLFIGLALGTIMFSFIPCHCSGGGHDHDIHHEDLVDELIDNHDGHDH